MIPFFNYPLYSLSVPAVIPVHVALRSKLKDSVQHALALNERLKRVIAVKSRTASGGFHGKIDFSSPPWNASAANLIMDLHSQAREAEALLRLTLHLPSRPRGGSDGNTLKALEGIVRLSEGADDGSVRANTRWLDSWSRRASIALGETEAPRRIPQQPGSPVPSCPWCKRDTLRSFPLHGIIKCVDISCKDTEGRRPSAKMEFSTVMNDWTLVWMDQEVGVP